MFAMSGLELRIQPDNAFAHDSTLYKLLRVAN